MKKIIFASLLGLLIFGNNNLLVKAETKAINPIEIDNVFNWISTSDSGFQKDGAHGVRKYDSNDKYANGIGIKQQFDVSNNQIASVEFQIPDYDDETRTLLENHTSISIPYDIFLINVDTGFNTRFRIWSSNSTNPGETSSWMEFCEQETSNWETYSGGYISGVFTNNSSFKISFDTTNFFSGYCSWLDEMVPFHKLGEIGNKEEQYLSFMQKHYGDATNIEFWFAHSELEADTINEVVIKNINGQTMCLNDDGMLEDNVAPCIPAIQKSTEQVYTKNTEYTLRIEKWLHSPNTSADFYVRPIMDFASVADDLVTNSKLRVYHNDEETFSYVGNVDTTSSLIKQISFPNTGKYKLVLEVTDLAGNIGLSDPLEIEVTKGYDIVLDGEFPTVGYTNQEIILPTATATDKNNVQRSVTIKVEDPIGNEITVENNKFTPTSIGIYYVTYSSSYIEDDVTYNASQIEREIIVSKGKPSEDDKPNNTPKTNTGLIIGASVGAVIVVAGLILTFVIIKKRK